MADLKTMHQDIIKTANIAGVGYSDEVIQQAFAVYGEQFAKSAVEFRTTTKPMDKRDVSLRYVEFDTEALPFQIALDAGLLQDDGSPVYRLVPDVHEAFKVIGTGADFGVNYGMEKVWAFLGIVPLERAYAVDSLPESVKAHADFYKKYNMNQITLVAIDYRGKTMNLYFLTEDPAHRTPEILREMLTDLGLEAPSDEMLAYSAQTPSIAVTYNWDSPKIQRLCFYVPHGSGETVPVHFDPLVERFVKEVPILSDQRAFVVSWTVSANGSYIKLENDYSGTVMAAFQQSLTTPTT